jgi:S1-C subfamily serine protease
MVKEFLSQKGMSFREKDVSRDQFAAQELVSRTGQAGVPVTVIDGETIVGFDRARLEEALAQRQRGQRPSFGAAIADASKITARQGSGITLGAYVGRVKSGSTAERLGLTQDDIITEVNMQNIANASDLERALSEFSRGSRLLVVFLRGNKKLAAEGLF